MNVSIRKATNGYMLDVYRPSPVASNTPVAYEPECYVFNSLEDAIAKTKELLA